MNRLISVGIPPWQPWNKIAFKRTTKLPNKQCLDVSRHSNHMKDKKNAVSMRENAGAKMDD